MLLRAPPLLLLSRASSPFAPPQWLCAFPRDPSLSDSFHTSAPRRSDGPIPSHYHTLQLSPSASSADIKRQFYMLSKQHHPDRNPSDPTASTRFVAISEAYHVLSVPSKRAQYDMDLHRQSVPRWGRPMNAGHDPQGSHSSTSFAGSRPASGLNKKRGTFRGPPPSFYKNGAYGRHSAKRSEYAYTHNQHRPQAAWTKEGEHAAGQERFGGFGRFGPGQATQPGSEVPHFDDVRHKKTHEHVYEHIYARKRRVRASEESEEVDRGGMMINFILVAGAVGLIGLTAKMFGDEKNSSKVNEKQEG